MIAKRRWKLVTCNLNVTVLLSLRVAYNHNEEGFNLTFMILKRMKPIHCSIDLIAMEIYGAFTSSCVDEFGVVSAHFCPSGYSFRL